MSRLLAFQPVRRLIVATHRTAMADAYDEGDSDGMTRVLCRIVDDPERRLLIAVDMPEPRNPYRRGL